MDSLWEKAREAANDARFLHEAGRYDSACNRAYYAMFNAARALLLRRGISPDDAKRHATVLQQFSLHFVKNGPFDAADGRALAEAGRIRNQADYSSKVVEVAAVEDLMAALNQFMAKASRLLATEEEGT